MLLTLRRSFNTKDETLSAFLGAKLLYDHLCPSLSHLLKQSVTQSWVKFFLVVFLCKRVVDVLYDIFSLFCACPSFCIFYCLSDCLFFLFVWFVLFVLSYGQLVLVYISSPKGMLARKSTLYCMSKKSCPLIHSKYTLY